MSAPAPGAANRARRTTRALFAQQAGGDRPTLGWLVVHSLWIIPAFVPVGVGTWLAFVLLPVFARRPKYAQLSGMFLGLSLVAVVVSPTGSPNFFLALVWLLGMIVSLVVLPRALRSAWDAEAARRARPAGTRADALPGAEHPPRPTIVPVPVSGTAAGAAGIAAATGAIAAANPSTSSETELGAPRTPSPAIEQPRFPWQTTPPAAEAPEAAAGEWRMPWLASPEPADAGAPADQGASTTTGGLEDDAAADSAAQPPQATEPAPAQPDLGPGISVIPPTTAYDPNA